jgi:hypothetical protein
MIRVLLSLRGGTMKSLPIFARFFVSCIPLSTLAPLAPAFAAPPAVQDVEVYLSLCRVGSQTTFTGVAGLDLDLNRLLTKRLLGGEAKLSGSKLTDEFPKISDEKNLMSAIRSFQDCVYRYVERFHAAAAPGASSSPNSAIVGPNVSPERRREIVYLANELDSFKQKMIRTTTSLPATFYDKRSSTERRPKDDPRLIGLADYSRYRAFESATGGLDFSNATNSDLVLLCSTYFEELNDYNAFARQYQPLQLPAYAAVAEVRRMCAAASRGR